jgi:integrase
MASLWRHPKSKYWTACFTDHVGRQKKRSTKKTDRDEAMTIALEYERAESSARDGILTEAQCRRVLSDILEKTTGQHIRHTSTEEYFKDWVNSKELIKSERTMYRYRTTVDLFLKHIGKLATRPLSGVAPRDIQGFLNARIKAGCAPKTVVVDAKTLGTAFNRAKREGILQANPVEAIDLPQVDSSERETFTAAQVKLLVDALPGMDFGANPDAEQKRTDWQTAIYLGFFTGARLRDCTDMKWTDIDLTQGVIRYQPQKTKSTTKTGRYVVVPLHQELERHLHAVAKDNADADLCPTLSGRDSGGAHGLSQRFKAIMRQAGISTLSGKGKGTRLFSRLTFHSLRHSFNSALANAGVSQELRMKLTGHKTAIVNSGYTHHEIDPLRKAIAKLPSLSSVQSLLV